jgi:hypothetical protein
VRPLAAVCPNAAKRSDAGDQRAMARSELPAIGMPEGAAGHYFLEAFFFFFAAFFLPAFFAAFFFFLAAIVYSCS